MRTSKKGCGVETWESNFKDAKSHKNISLSRIILAEPFYNGVGKARKIIKGQEISKEISKEIVVSLIRKNNEKNLPIPGLASKKLSN